MNFERSWGLVLGIALSALSALGNTLRQAPTTVSVFPDVLTLIALPLLLALGLRLYARRHAGCTVAGLRRAGWSMVWPAALLFAIFITVLGALRFEHPTVGFALVGFGGALIATAGLGYLAVFAFSPGIARPAAAERLDEVRRSD